MAKLGNAKAEDLAPKQTTKQQKKTVRHLRKQLLETKENILPQDINYESLKENDDFQNSLDMKFNQDVVHSAPHTKPASDHPFYKHLKYKPEADQADKSLSSKIMSKEKSRRDNHESFQSSITIENQDQSGTPSDKGFAEFFKKD